MTPLEQARAAMLQASFALRTIAPEDKDAAMSVQMLDAALAALSKEPQALPPPPAYIYGREASKNERVYTTNAMLTAQREAFNAGRAYAEQARTAPGPIQWPKARDLFIRDDMGMGQLRVLFDSDNDVIVALWPNAAPSVSLEFCNGGGGGGKSPNVRKALIALMVAMEQDGASPRPKE
jgi:hypothetical protein